RSRTTPRQPPWTAAPAGTRSGPRRTPSPGPIPGASRSQLAPPHPDAAVPPSDLVELWRHAGRADRPSVPAAGGERAGSQPVVDLRRGTGDSLERRVLAQPGHGTQQRPRVRVTRLIEQRAYVGLFHEQPPV